MDEKDDEPRDIESEYPWGKKTATYQAWLILFAINIIVMAVMFLVYIEIPFMQGEDVFAGFDLDLDSKAFAQLTDPGTDLEVDIEIEERSEGEKEDGSGTEETVFLILCWIVIFANIVTVWIMKTVGTWVSELETQCKKRKCNWWCLCCNKWHCLLVWIVKWVTYIIMVASTILTSALLWVCNNPNIQWG